MNTLDWNRTPVDGGPNMSAENATGIFHTVVQITPEQLTAGVILSLGKLDETGDVLVNGQRAGGNTTPRLQGFSRDITKLLKAGKNEIVALVANTDHMGGLYGAAYLLPRGRVLSDLEVSSEAQGMREKVWENDKASWSKIAADAPASVGLSWYKMEFPTPATQPGVWVPYHLHLEAGVDGQIYFNGHHLGTYWAAGPQRDVWLPECWLNSGPGAKNVIAIQGVPDGSGPLFKDAEVLPYKEFAEKR
jgi:hypothetical protein